MKQTLLLVMCLLSICKPLLAFYVVVSDTTKSASLSKNTAIIEILEPSKDKIFPLKFKCTITTLNNEKLSLIFEKTDGELNNPIFKTDAYTVKNGKTVVKLDGEKIEIRTYKSKGNDAFATLTNNSDLTNSANSPFRALIRVVDKQIAYDIVPLVKQTTDVKTGKLVPSNLIGHAIYEAKRVESSGSYNDFLTIPSAKIQNARASRHVKRAVGGQPVPLYVEVLIVADYSVLQKHRLIYSTTNDNLCFYNMKIYYAHLINGANQRYVNSLSADPDLTIQIKLKNYLFLTTTVSWTDINSVGVSGYPTYQGKEVIVASQVLDAFKTYMDSLTLSFTYDHAAALMDKDLWSDTTTATAATRSGVAGLSWVGGMCGAFRYSLTEDSGFSNIGVVAHEIGHNLGSPHDGTGTSSSCPISSNYIMTPSVGSYTSNLLNQLKFSSCSISAFKRTLLSGGNGALLSTYNCLADVPINFPIESSYFTDIMSGQLFSADDQCKMIVAANSTQTGCSATTICTQLKCLSEDGTYCTSIPGVGAVDGTSCDTNKVCSQGVCVASSITKVTNFPANPCSPNPCLNSGTCIKINQFYYCNCASGYTGFNCNSTATTAATIAKTNNCQSIQANILHITIFSLIVYISHALQ